jgi:hypothetical protein
MTHILNAQERKLLAYLQLDDQVYQVRGQIPPGIGVVTLGRLTALGLLETGPGRFGDTGWRLTDDGWRCMYGKPKTDLGAEGAPHHELKIWSWPPTPDQARKPAAVKPRLKTLTPRLKELPSVLSPLGKPR